MLMSAMAVVYRVRFINNFVQTDVSVHVQVELTMRNTPRLSRQISYGHRCPRRRSWTFVTKFVIRYPRGEGLLRPAIITSSYQVSSRPRASRRRSARASRFHCQTPKSSDTALLCACAMVVGHPVVSVGHDQCRVGISNACSVVVRRSFAVADDDDLAADERRGVSAA